MSREERIAQNEAWCRDLNQRKAHLVSGDSLVGASLVAGFRCECWRMECSDRIRLSRREWQEVRERGNRFAVAPGHVGRGDVEEVVREYPHFWVVEKRGEAGEIAEQLS